MNSKKHDEFPAHASNEAMPLNNLLRAILIFIRANALRRNYF